MRFSYLLPALLLYFTPIFAQNSSFEKIYEPAEAQELAGVQCMADGFVSAGTYHHTVPFLRKTDLSGNFMWEKRLSLPFSAEIFSLMEANDGGFLLSGQSDDAGTTAGRRLLLVKLDVSGNILWAKQYNQYSVAVKIEKLPGGYLLAGSQWGDTFGDNDGAISQIDNDGNLVLSRTYGRYQKFVHFTDIVKNDNMVYAIGSVMPDNALVFIATDYNTGFPLSIKKIEFPGTALAGQIHPAAGQNLLITGAAILPQNPPAAEVQVPWVKKIDPAGQELWTRHFSSPDAASLVLRRSYTTSDGGLLLLVSAEGLGDARSAGVIKIDQDGQVLWAKYFGDKYQDDLNTACELPDSSLLFAGAINLLEGAGDTLHTPWFVRTSAEGELAECCNRTFTVTAIDSAQPLSDWFLDDGTFLQEAFPFDQLASTDAALTAADFCSTQCYHPACDVTLSLGPDIQLCRDSVVMLSAGTTFPQVLWQDGSTGSGFAAAQPGLYWVQVTDSCDVVQRDTVEISLFVTGIALACPPSLMVTAAPYAQSAQVDYGTPALAGDCPCGGLSVSAAGPASGSDFPLGNTTVCYEAADACENSTSCCFQVTVLPAPPEPACDAKKTACILFELLSVDLLPDGRKNVRVRVTNTCSATLDYAAFQLPAGMNADAPLNGELYASIAGHTYWVKNPNPSPFHSIRFKNTLTNGIANGQSDIFEYTLSAQATPTYILSYARLKDGATYQAHLNTFGCFDQAQSRDHAAPPAANTLLVYPNPTRGLIYVDMHPYEGQRVEFQLRNSLGLTLLEKTITVENWNVELHIPEWAPEGLYFLSAQGAKGERRLKKIQVSRE